MEGLTAKFKDLKDRILFTLFVLIVYRFGCYLPLPGIDLFIVRDIFSNFSNGFFGMFNVFSGGALSRMTIFALNVMPYIVSSIVLQLAIALFKNDSKRSINLEKRKLNFYTKLLTMVIAIVQSYLIIKGLEVTYETSIFFDKLQFRFVSIITIVVGTMFLVWLGDQINSKGIGNGISLIIFAGIISELPSAIISLGSMVKVGTYSAIFVFLIMLFFVLFLFIIVFFERSCRNILITYSHKWFGTKFRPKNYNTNVSHIPIKLNMAGVIPPIFANSILLLPISFANFYKGSFLSDIFLHYFQPGGIFYMIFYAFLIMFFCFFYSGFVFNANDVANNLKKSGAIIAGKRPGKFTAVYLNYVIFRINVIGGLYISFVCIIPEFLRHYYHVSFFVVSGTSILIVVNVTMELISQIQSYVLSFKYDKLTKKTGVWGV